MNFARAGLRLRCALWIGMLAAAWAGQPPRPSPPFTILRNGAPNIELRQYRGKVVALAFIYTTCPHCQNLTRAWNFLAREYAARDVQFLLCAFNSDAAATMPDFVSLFQPPYPVGWSFQAPVRQYLAVSPTDGTFMVPHLVFLDRAGTIRREVRGQDDFFQDTDTNIRKQLDLLLGPGAGKKK